MSHKTVPAAAVAVIAFVSLAGCTINNPVPVAAAPPAPVVVQTTAPAPATVLTPTAGSVVVQPAPY